MAAEGAVTSTASLAGAGGGRHGWRWLSWWKGDETAGSVMPASTWWSASSFTLGAVLGAGVALLFMSSPPLPKPWRRERFGRNSLRVPPKEEILDRFRMPLDSAEYEDVRTTWKRLALARSKKDCKEAAQCFARDCVIEDCSTGHGWRGRGGIEDYYTELFKAIPDANFETIDLFIGPQGVVQEVLLTGTHKGQWQVYKPSGRLFHCRMVILMPWDSDSHLFAGEKIYLDSDDVFRQL